jgi:hypothetical protein
MFRGVKNSTICLPIADQRDSLLRRSNVRAMVMSRRAIWKLRA